MPIRNERGVTLIEAVAAMLVLSVVVIVFLNVSGYSALAGRQADKQQEARRIAEEQLHQWRALLLEDPSPSLPYASTTQGYAVYIQSASVGNVQYETSAFGSRHVSLQAFALLGGQPEVVTVTVSWEGGP
ncbi:type IV pilus modification PilV family protein [Paenibacillus sp.]|uniref:type IV pilus modification PilV family protein n=1 Tax=Paenibacillus sp. TaxID=58172 RepID=UPI002D42B119|nr:prepilin-type N-terminal cleavage/methylation domain-containing protein [Paenibacillus sp.]HZG88498.1 prepilin-type N-terminal cleavage/methylation domain-containing protein [Paenibacillus sp.]